ncbi:MAG TPA: AAA family ATPase [Kofleriaceae bacterium]|nr:AAA family ATPase [Kofleriaceae bacterium]
MSRRFTRGLVVGKFAPLHLGHEHLIGAASAACDEIVILSYCDPEPPGCPAERRRRWLAARFPFARSVVVTAAWLAAHQAGGAAIPPDAADGAEHRRFVAWLLDQVLAAPVDAVFTSEPYGDPLAAALTDRFRTRDPAARAVVHVAVDPGRRAVPISARDIRADVHEHRRWLAPEVYASFVRRVAIVGGESSGKSTLAEALAARFETAWVPEYGRELWTERGGHLEPADLLHIAEEQVAREEAALRAAHRFLFCDTTPLTTRFYAGVLFGAVDPGLVELARRRYDLTVLCVPDFPFVQDGTRQDAGFRARQHAYYLEALVGEPLVEATGEPGARVDAVARALRDRFTAA